MPPLPLDIDLFLTRKRGRKNERRQANNAAKWARRRESMAAQNDAFGRTSRVIDMLAEAARKHIIARKMVIKVVIPEVFSIIENPATTVAAILGFAAGLRRSQKNVREMYFDHSKMKRYDLAASAILDIVAVEFDSERRRRGARRPQARGMFPKDPALARFIRGVGIIRHLGIKHEAPKPADAQRLEVIDARNHNYEMALPRVIDRKSKVTADFVAHINKCLGRVGKQLSDEGRLRLVNYLGEILSNAEEHADFRDWTVQGYLDESLPTPMCEIAIFNFGRSIAESLDSVDRDGYTWTTHVAPYLQQHQDRGLFGAYWQKNDLLTVIALQGHVSRKNVDANALRGQGSVDLIRFFQSVHKECNDAGQCEPARMAIVSGGTYILFDGTYEMACSDSGSMVIAFNKQNSLMHKPDGKFVQSLGDLSFPGTIISIRFPLALTSGDMIGEAQHGSADDH